MSDYRRLISYIYSYENGVKTRNSGFAKVEARDGECKISISLKITGGLKNEVEDNTLEVFMFTRKDGKVYKTNIGRIRIANGNSMFRAQYDEQKIGNKQFPLSDIAGIFICDKSFLDRTGNGNIAYASEWDDTTVLVDEFLDESEVSVDSAEQRNSEETDVSEQRNGEEADASEQRSGDIESIVDSLESGMVESGSEYTGYENSQSQSLFRDNVIEKQQLQKQGNQTENRQLQNQGNQTENRQLQNQGNQTENRQLQNQGNQVENRKLQNNAIEDNELHGNSVTNSRLQNAGLQNSKSHHKAVGNAGTSDMSAVELRIQNSNFPTQKKTQTKEDIQKYQEQLQNLIMSPTHNSQSSNIRSNNMSGNNTTGNNTAVNNAAGNNTTGNNTAVNNAAGNNAVGNNATGNNTIENPRKKDYFTMLCNCYPNLKIEGLSNRCIKITPHDISYLPRRYWHLGNNSFLLHGFYNYRYVLLCEVTQDMHESDNADRNGSQRYMICVPGIYGKREQTIAKTYGFSDFKEIPQENVKNFGYWCFYL